MMGRGKTTAAINHMTMWKKEVSDVDGLAASAASVIALAGDKVIIPENAFFMIHHAWTSAAGNVNELENVVGRRSIVEAVRNAARNGR